MKFADRHGYSCPHDCLGFLVVCVCVRAVLADTDVRQDVDVHERSSGRVRDDDRGRRPQGPQLQGQVRLHTRTTTTTTTTTTSPSRQVRLPARVDDERVPQPAEAVQHHQSRQQPRLERLRHRHADRIRPPVKVRSGAPPTKLYGGRAGPILSSRGQIHRQS